MCGKPSRRCPAKLRASSNLLRRHIWAQEIRHTKEHTSVVQTSSQRWCNFPPADLARSLQECGFTQIATCAISQLCASAPLTSPQRHNSSNGRGRADLPHRAGYPNRYGLLTKRNGISPEPTSHRHIPRIRASFARHAGHGFPDPGHLLADVSAIIGSLDIVFGEIDR